jgi:tellurite methyltransferase
MMTQAAAVTSEHILSKKSVDFFENQFQRQVREQDYALNPFEILALDYVKGSILDVGCGLGNLSLEAGRRGHRVLSVDAIPTAVVPQQRRSARSAYRAKHSG